jgi:hypothetical protein
VFAEPSLLAAQFWRSADMPQYVCSLMWQEFVGYLQRYLYLDYEGADKSLAL